MNRATKLLVMVLAFLTVAGAAQAQTTLRFKYKEGEKLDYVMDQDQKIAMSVNGMDIDMKVTMKIDMAWDVLSVEQDGSAKIKVKVGRVKMSMDSPFAKADIDSADNNEPEDAMTKMFGQIVKGIAATEMTFVADARGDMKNLKVSESAMKKFKGLPGMDKLGDIFSPENFKSMVSSNMVLPKDPVNKGDVWSQKSDAKLPFGKSVGTTKYTFDGTIEKNGKSLDKILVKPEVKIESDPDAAIQIKVKDSKTKGYILFDNKAGQVAETSTESTMQMEMEVAGMSITQNITQNMTMRLKGKTKSESKSDSK